MSTISKSSKTTPRKNSYIWRPESLSKDQLGSLLEISRLVNQSLNNKEVVHTILEEVIKLLHCEFAALYWPSKHNNNTYKAVASNGYHTHLISGFALLFQSVLNEPVCRLDDAYHHESYVKELKQLGFDRKVQSLLFGTLKHSNLSHPALLVAVNRLPLHSRDSLLSFLKGSRDRGSFLDLTPSNFNAESEALISHFAHIASSSLANAEIYKECFISRNRADALLNLISTLGDDVSIQSAIVALTSHATELVRSEHCTVLLVNPCRTYLWSLATDTGKEVRISLKKGAAGLCATTGSVIISENPHADTRFKPVYGHLDVANISNTLCVPIKSKGEVKAVVQLINKKGDEMESVPFNDDDVHVLEVFAKVVAPRLSMSDFVRFKPQPTEAGLAFKCRERKNNNGMLKSKNATVIIEEESLEED